MSSSPASPYRAGLPQPATTLVLVALVIPWLLTLTWPPSSTFLNQAAAWAAWAVFIGLVLGRSTDGLDVAPAQVGSDIWPVLTIFVVMGLACAVSPLWTGLPASLVWSTLATLAGAAVALAAGATMARQRRVTEALNGLFVPLVIAGSLSALIVVVQIFFSELAGNGWIAASAFPQRASGNLRQPNHLSSLAVWALIGVVWLHERAVLRRTFAAALALALVTSVVLTGSRTGLLGIVILAVWATADRSLSPFSRRLLWMMPLVYALGWWLFRLWAARSFGDVGSVDRIAAGGDISSARFAIWSNTLDLIVRHPWFGVGFGDFNLAWSLTPFPDRPLQFYDHTHNLLLQWAVELGLPLALLLTTACTVAMWRVLQVARLADGADRVGLRSAFMAILLIMLHSMLEYPLWYSYFLLPTAFAFGVCLGGGPASRTKIASGSTWQMATLLRGASVLMLVVITIAVFDYRKVVVIFAPPTNAPPLEERMADGKHSIFFAHHAHYASATTAGEPASAAESFRNASHFLLDTRFTMAWAKSYAERGETDKARFLADRLREFRNPASIPFFEFCGQPTAGDRQVAFQCRPADAEFDYRDFR